MKKIRVRYALVNEDGSPATWCHQDDMETPIVANTLAKLIDQMGDWCDCGSSYVLDNLDGAIFTDEANSGDKFRIIRQVIKTTDLQPEDLAVLKTLHGEDH